MKRIVYLSLIILSLLATHLTAAASDPIDRMMFFGGSQPNHIPRHIDTLFSNAVARQIAIACLPGASMQQLQTLGVSDLQSHIDHLVKDSLLTLRNGKYFLTVPVFVGARRDRLRQITDSGAAKLAPAVAKMISRLQEKLKAHPEMVFHILWSRVIDANWWPLFQSQFTDRPSPPSLAWIVEPVHPYQVGTNFWSMQNEDELAVTWGYGCEDCLENIDTYRPYLIGKSSAPVPPDSARLSLQSHGYIDASSRPAIFSYGTDDGLDSLMQFLKDDYAVAMHNVYDYPALSREFGIPTDDFFVILMHETAYSLFENLDISGKLSFPILLIRGDNKSCVRLASIRRL